MAGMGLPHLIGRSLMTSAQVAFGSPVTHRLRHTPFNAAVGLTAAPPQGAAVSSHCVWGQEGRTPWAPVGWSGRAPCRRSDPSMPVPRSEEAGLLEPREEPRGLQGATSRAFNSENTRFVIT